ncbi:hypothetical protein Tco_0507174, partial [Tanacetum coccineum]
MSEKLMEQYAADQNKLALIQSRSSKLIESRPPLVFNANPTCDH